MPSFTEIDTVGGTGALIIFVLVIVFAYLAYSRLPVLSEKMFGSDASASSPTPSPDMPIANRGGAPLVGPPKEIIAPVAWDQRIEDGVYSFPEKPVIRWDLIPHSAYIVTVGFAISNPPLTGESPKREMVHLFATMPASNGFAAGFKNRGHYYFNAGREKYEFKRDFSKWDSSVERMELRFVQAGQNICRVEAVYNGTEYVIRERVENCSILALRQWPQQLQLFDRTKIRDIWITYA